MRVEAGAGQGSQEVSAVVEVDVTKSVDVVDEVGIEMTLVNEEERRGGEGDVAEMVTIVEGLRDLPSLYGENGSQDVYVIQALDDS